MTDYLSKVGRPGKVFACVGLGLAFATLLVLNLLVVITLNIPEIRDEVPGPLIGSGLILGLLAIVSAWMLVRLFRRERSPNGVTMMPLWFIQVFGVLLGAGIALAALFGGHRLFVIQGLVVALNMVLIRRHLRGKRPDDHGG